jgi:hypothetical protein
MASNLIPGHSAMIVFDRIVSQNLLPSKPNDIFSAVPLNRSRQVRPFMTSFMIEWHSDSRSNYGICLHAGT